jgi:hypothetical protein
MSDQHYSDDDLVALLLGMGPADAHLANCELCSGRWRKFQKVHQLRRAEIEVPADLLAAQRRAVYARVDQKPGKFRSAWLPLPVVALLVLLIIAVFRPASQKITTDVISEDKALQDVFTVASRIDAAGLKPVKSLFEVQK